MRQFWEEFLLSVMIVCLITAAGVLSIGVFVNAITYVWEKDQCSRYAVLSNAQTYYAWSTPCYVKTKDGRWVTLASVTGNSSDITVREGH